MSNCKGFEEHSMVMFAPVAPSKSVVLESSKLPYDNAEECHQVFWKAYQGVFKRIDEKMKRALR